jgi:hypothetical protein
MAWFRNKSYDPRYQTGSTLLCVRCIWIYQNQVNSTTVEIVC